MRKCLQIKINIKSCKNRKKRQEKKVTGCKPKTLECLICILFTGKCALCHWGYKKDPKIFTYSPFGGFSKSMPSKGHCRERKKKCKVYGFNNH